MDDPFASTTSGSFLSSFSFQISKVVETNRGSHLEEFGHPPLPPEVGQILPLEKDNCYTTTETKFVTE